MRSLRALLSSIVGLFLLAVPTALAAHVHVHQDSASVNGACGLCAMSHASTGGELSPPPPGICLSEAPVPLPQAETAPTLLLLTGPAVRGPPAGLL